MITTKQAKKTALTARKTATKTANRVLKTAIQLLPAIPLLRARRKSSVLPLVLGAIGVATIGGVAAVLIFSPRTRYRAMDAAKGAYGKVSDQLDAMGVSEKLGIHKSEARVANGLSHEGSIDYAQNSF